MQDIENDTFEAGWRAALQQPAARAAWAALKLTAAGEQPVSLQRLGEAVGLPGEEAVQLARQFLDLAVHEGLVRLERSALPGPARYRVQIGARPMREGGGCAVDMFLLTLATGEPVHAESICPVTDTPIRVDLTPEGVTRVVPATTVVAMVEQHGVELSSPEQVDALVCSQQPFFASAEASANWLAQHPSGRVFPVQQFFERYRDVFALLDG